MLARSPSMNGEAVNIDIDEAQLATTEAVTK